MCVFMSVRVCVCALCVVLVCMWMRLMDCQCVDSAAFVLVYVAYIVLYALRVFPAVTRLTVYRRLRVLEFFIWVGREILARSRFNT